MVTSLVYKITTLYSKYRNTQPLMTQVSTSFSEANKLFYLNHSRLNA